MASFGLEVQFVFFFFFFACLFQWISDYISVYLASNLLIYFIRWKKKVAYLRLPSENNNSPVYSIKIKIFMCCQITYYYFFLSNTYYYFILFFSSENIYINKGQKSKPLQS